MTADSDEEEDEVRLTRCVVYYMPANVLSSSWLPKSLRKAFAKDDAAHLTEALPCVAIAAPLHTCGTRHFDTWLRRAVIILRGT
jgi:hypothetical protein